MRFIFEYVPIRGVQNKSEESESERISKLRRTFLAVELLVNTIFLDIRIRLQEEGTSLNKDLKQILEKDTEEGKNDRK